jgi:hypothetical protein
VGFGVLCIGAFLGGHVVFMYGYLVNQNAFSSCRKAM